MIVKKSKTCIICNKERIEEAFPQKPKGAGYRNTCKPCTEYFSEERRKKFDKLLDK